MLLMKLLFKQEHTFLRFFIMLTGEHKGQVSIGTASAYSVEYHGIGPLMYIDDLL